MHNVNPRRILCGATAFLLVLLCSVLVSFRAFASESVTVDFVTSSTHTQSEGASFDQNGYLYFNNDNGAADAWVEFPIEGLAEGSYTVSLVYKTHDKNGVFQTYIDGTALGDPVNLHGSNSGDLTKELGTVTITARETHSVKLQVLENEYKKYRITVKSIQLTPVADPVSPEPPTGVDFGQKVISSSGNVEVWPKPYIYEASSDYTSVIVDGVPVPVVGYTGWYDYANFSMKGQESGGDPVSITVTYKEPIQSYDISPKKLGLNGDQVTVSGNTLSFTIENDEYIIIRINGQDRRLVLLADPWETDRPANSGEGIYNVLAEPYSADRTGALLATEAIQKAIDDASAYGTEKGNGARGVVYIPTGVYQISSLALKSNVELYLEGGADLQLTLDKTQYRQRGFKNSIGKPVLHMLYTYNNMAGDPYDGDDTWYNTVYQDHANYVESSNIKIYGRGTIDARGEEADKIGWLSETLVPQNCSNLISDGIIYRDSGVWSINVVSSDHLTFTNLKVLNTFFHENDCIDICNSQDVVVRNAFGCALDDPFSSKTFQRGELFQSVCGPEEEIHNVLFEDCISWTCCYGFKVGQGSIFTQDGVTFKDGVVYECSVGVGVEHKYGTAELKNITFENIDIEHVGMSNGAMKNWLAFQCVTGATEGQSPLSNITLKNINVYDYGPAESRIVGYDQNSLIENIRFENIYIDQLGRNAASLEDLNIREYYMYAKGITIDGAAMQDAPSPVSYLFENLKDNMQYSDPTQTPEFGSGYVYYGKAVGDWISFPITVQEPGTYDLDVFLKYHPTKGIFQTYVNDQPVGNPVDQYTKGNTDKVSVKLGKVTLNKAGTQEIKFQITGKNAASRGYQLVLNGVMLTLVEPHTHSPNSDWITDGDTHWHECTTCGEILDKESHTASDWIVETKPTETQKGTRYKECTVCHYQLETEEFGMTVSGNNNVAGSTKDLINAILTPEDKEALANGQTVAVEVKVDTKDAPTAQETQQVQEKSAGYSIGAYFDISISKTVGTTSTEVHETASAIEIQLTLPDDLINTNPNVRRTYKVVRIHEENGNTLVDLLDVTYHAGYNKLAFKSKLFSTYAVIYTDTPVNVSNPSQTSGKSQEKAAAVTGKLCPICGYNNCTLGSDSLWHCGKCSHTWAEYGQVDSTGKPVGKTTAPKSPKTGLFS